VVTVATAVPLVQMRNITKRFSGVVALNDVDLDIYPGQVLAIVGDNGAGKSTLIKILTGIFQPSSGTMTLDGEPLELLDHSDATAAGIDAVYQTLALADHLDPAANMFLGSELTKSVLGFDVLDNKRMLSEAIRTLDEKLGVQLPDMSQETSRLSGGQRQAIAIARAIYHADLRLLVMDEPTAALGPQETARTIQLIQTLRENGLALVVISHSLDDVFEIADRILVLRRGVAVGVVNAAETSREEVLGLITGASSRGGASDEPAIGA
jgi:ABC-type sugar transport system ATPase subunit